MTDLLDNAARWLTSQRRQHLSRLVQYQRGQDSVEIPATVGQTVTETTDDYGASIQHVSRDYLIAFDDLVLDGAPVDPARGDRIIDDCWTYEVLTTPGGAHFQVDRHRTTFRIHTRVVETSA